MSNLLKTVFNVIVLIIVVLFCAWYTVKSIPVLHKILFGCDNTSVIINTNMSSVIINTNNNLSLDEISNIGIVMEKIKNARFINNDYLNYININFIMDYYLSADHYVTYKFYQNIIPKISKIKRHLITAYIAPWEPCYGISYQYKWIVSDYFDIYSGALINSKPQFQIISSVSF